MQHFRNLYLPWNEGVRTNSQVRGLDRNFETANSRSEFSQPAEICGTK